MNKFLILILILFISLSAKSQFADVFEIKYPSYKDALKAGDDSFKASKYSGAASAYLNAKNLAKNDEEIATAYTGLAKSIAKDYSQENHIKSRHQQSWTDQQAEKARNIFLLITQLQNVSDDTKAQAFLAMTDYYEEEKDYYKREALKKDHYTQVLALKNINPQVRIKTLFLRKTKQDLLDVIDIKEATDKDKASAYAALAGISSTDHTKLGYYEKIIELKNISGYQLYTAIFNAADLYAAQFKITEIRKVLAMIDNVKDVPFYKRAQAYCNIAETYFYEKNIAAGKMEMEKVGKIKNGTMKDYVEAFVNNATTYIKYQLFEEAQQEYKDALNVKEITDNFEAYVYFNNGNMYFNKSDAAEARKVWEKVSNLKLDSIYHPYKLKSLESVGKSFYAEKNYTDAAKIFQQMVNIKESPAKERLIARFLLAQVLTKNNKIKEAGKEYEIIVKDKEAGFKLRAEAGMENIALYKATAEPKKLSEAMTILTSIIMYPSYQLNLSEEDEKLFNKLQGQFKWDVNKVTIDLAKETATVPYAIDIHKSFVNFDTIIDKYQVTTHWEALAKIYEAQKDLNEAKNAYKKIIEIGIPVSKKQAELSLERLK